MVCGKTLGMIYEIRHKENYGSGAEDDDDDDYDNDDDNYVSNDGGDGDNESWRVCGRYVGCDGGVTD